MSPPRQLPTTFTRLTDAEMAGARALVQGPESIVAAEIDTVQARVRMRIACAFLSALKPDLPRRTSLRSGPAA